jgi:hypothetical protein
MPFDLGLHAAVALGTGPSCVDSLAYTLGCQMTPDAQRKRTRINAATRAMRSAMVESRRRTILGEREENRTYAAIGREHGITRERVRQMADRPPRARSPRMSRHRKRMAVRDIPRNFA